MSRRFNPRPRTGGDVNFEAHFANTTVVSIHAPARGATKFVGHSLRSGQCFNPRPRTGGDNLYFADIMAS